MNALTLDHFIKVHEMLAGYYGGTVPNVMGCTLAFKALQQAAPNMTNGQLDYAVMQAMTRCKFMPRIPDLMEELYQRNEENLPQLPDIDPNMCDSYQQGIYYRALSDRNKAKTTAPFDPDRYRDDRDIPGIVYSALPPRKEFRMTGRMNEWYAMQKQEQAETQQEFGTDNVIRLNDEQYVVPDEAWDALYPNESTRLLSASA